MRLTLRTLLAYLDDTLEPDEIKEIGQKVAESDAAQELIARIKQVTRRRRLTTPPPGGPNAKFDANTIAEYLDNELSTDLVADLEKTCLESDVHLAEVASCHQILTLVLGEPALVPPTARERMYGLVKGREAIPFRKARSRDGAGADEGVGDDALLPGLPASRGWLLWVLPVAALLVLAALAAAVWQALPAANPAVPVAAVKPGPQSTQPSPDDNPPPTATTAAPAVAPVKDESSTPPAGTTVLPPPAGTTTGPPPPADTARVNPMPPVEPPSPPDERPKPPSNERVSVGAYAAPARGESSILVQREADQTGWKRLAPGKSDVFSTDDLVSLPGYNSELVLGPDGGTRLLLHGHVPQFTVHPFEGMDFLMDSAVRLYKPEAGFDLDLTLARGRIYLSNHKANGPVKVRLRFGGDATRTPPTPEEVWDLTLLTPGTEIGIDLMQGYTGDINYRDGDPPLQNLYLFLFAGRAGMKIESREYFNLPAPAAVLWDNRGAGAAAAAPEPVDPKVLPSLQAVWSQTPPGGGTQAERDAVANMRAALSDLAVRMTEKKAVDATLLEARQAEDQPMLRLLAVYSFGAIDAVDRVLDVLCTDENPAHDVDRDAAIFTLRRWLARGAGNGARLYDEKKGTGLLLGKNNASDSDTILLLLHDFPAEKARNQATFDELTRLLRHRSLPIRQLAYWQLLHLSAGVRQGVTLPAYNAAWSDDQRDASVTAWKALIGKELPPPAPAAPSPPAPAGTK